MVYHSVPFLQMSQRCEIGELGSFDSVPQDVCTIFGLIMLAGPAEISDYIEQIVEDRTFQLEDVNCGKCFFDVEFWKPFLWSKFHIFVGNGSTQTINGNPWPKGLDATFEQAKNLELRYILMNEKQSFYIVTLLWIHSMVAVLSGDNKWDWILKLFKGKFFN